MKALFTVVLALALAMIAMPAIAEVGPEYGTKAEITFDKTGLSNVSENYKLDPALSPDGKWIAFTTTVNSNLDGLWIVPSEGGTAELLYKGERFIQCLRFTPDSKELTFQHTVDNYYSKTLKAINLETKEMRVVLDNAGRAHWSKDGRYISFINFDPKAFTDELQAVHNGAMAIYDTVTGEKRYLVNDNLPGDPLKYLDPTISPDMVWVYFNIMASIDGNTVSQLYRMPFEGGQIEQLTFYENVKFGYCRNMNFSPDSKWLLFDYCFDVIVFNTETRTTFRAFPGTVTDSPQGLPGQYGETGWETSPSWMPDGTSFVYNLMSGGRLSTNVNGYEIYICTFNAAKYATNPTVVESSMPSDYPVLTNYPNPFNPSTTIEFNLTQPGPVNLSVYSLTGQKVCEIASGDMGVGKHSYIWNGRDSKGTPVSSGIFFTRLETRDNVISNRMMLVK